MQGACGLGLGDEVVNELPAFKVSASPSTNTRVVGGSGQIQPNLRGLGASRTLTSVGPNATLVGDDVGGFVRDLKARLSGEISVSGPDLAQTLTALGLIDEYRLYMRPVVLGRGRPFFAGPTPPLRLLASERIDEDTIRLTYGPA